MSVKLRQRVNDDGTTSQFLVIYNRETKKRTYEFLHSLKLLPARTPIERQANKEKKEMAERIRMQREQELAANEYNLSAVYAKKAEVLPWLDKYLEKYKKKDLRNMRGAATKFREFLKEDRRTHLTFGELDQNIITEFQDYLGQHHTGEGVSSYFNRFKKMIKQAVANGLLSTNPAAQVRTKKATAKRKDVLTVPELQLLSETSTESNEVKRAFLFSCLTGLRWVDVKNLTWKMIDQQAKQLRIRQVKTDLDLFINLNKTAVKLLGSQGQDNEAVFSLPSANGANKSLAAWVKRAGIRKEITWHCARHSFGTNLIFHGADISTASNLLGHTSLKHTQRYVRAANELKQRATDSLNFDL